jgi:aspartate kinase
MSLIVQKFGGTSVGSIERMKIVADIIARTKKAGNDVVIVVSAMGDETDRLKDLALQISKIPSPREMDMLLTTGERVSMALLSMALQNLGIESRSFTGSQSGILTDGVHGNARIQNILGDRIKSSLSSGLVAIVAGFQGMHLETKEITTLGRGGSDLTAVALAKALNAKLCEIFTDVKGVCTADPRKVKSTKLINQLSWSEMTDLAWMGAGVMHARAAHLSEISEIEVVIRSSFDLEHAGTRVKGKNMEKVHISAIAHKDDVSMLTLRFSDRQKAALSDAMDWFWKRGGHPLLSEQSLRAGEEVEVRLVIDSELAQDYASFIDESDSNSLTQKLVTDDLAAVSVVGVGFWQSPETISTIQSLVGDRIEMFDVRNNAVTICIEKQHLTEVLNKLHDSLIS